VLPNDPPKSPPSVIIAAEADEPMDAPTHATTVVATTDRESDIFVRFRVQMREREERTLGQYTTGRISVKQKTMRLSHATGDEGRGLAYRSRFGIR
jgi:hypothetical protein